MALNTITLIRFGRPRDVLDTYTQEGSHRQEKRDGGTEHRVLISEVRDL